jgi:hypothetical protein
MSPQLPHCSIRRCDLAGPIPPPQQVQSPPQSALWRAAGAPPRWTALVAHQSRSCDRPDARPAPHSRAAAVCLREAALRRRDRTLPQRAGAGHSRRTSRPCAACGHLPSTRPSSRRAPHPGVAPLAAAARRRPQLARSCPQPVPAPARAARQSGRSHAGGPGGSAGAALGAAPRCAAAPCSQAAGASRPV